MDNIKQNLPDHICFDDMIVKEEELGEVCVFYYEHIHPHCNDLRRWIRFKAPRMTKESVEDACSETITRAMEKKHQLRDINACKTWLFSIAENVINTYYRNEKRQTKLASGELDHKLSQSIQAYSNDPVDYTLEEVMKQCSGTLVKECLELLNEKQKEVFSLYYFNDMTFREVAEHMGETENRVYGWYRRGLMRLRRLMIKRGGMMDE